MSIRLIFVSLCFVALLGASLLGADPAATPEWLWTHRGGAAANEMALFRKTFTLAGEVKSATLTVAGDDRVTPFVNGTFLFEHQGWEQSQSEAVGPKLKKGDNVVALRGINGGGGPAAVICQLDVTLADGSKVQIVSDKSWVSASEQADGWQKPGFDAKGWKPATSLGKLGIAPWADTAFAAADGPVRKAIATDPAKIQVPAGFKVELVYAVPRAQQGSWVSMTADPKGRLICSDQGGSLYRVTPGKDEAATKVEKIELNIGQAQGLLYAFDTLYVVVNGGAAQGSGIYKVRDTNGDDQYDSVELMKKFNGGGEHGPHAVRLGPDGKTLYVIAGNHTEIPKDLAADSPHKNWDEDHLLQRNPDGNGHATGRMAPGGWVLRTDKDGKRWDIFCGGFRNQYDIAFNQDGELFSYDADMEWDTGAPWYRPTRVNHCVSGAEFGWRYGTGKWPAYYVDSVGAVVDIGLGSPTGIEFGTGAKFPAKYQRALFINDWTYGKIYAVHMVPQGGTYTANFETFCAGKPLPVTDVCVSPDGALYFSIGGRGTQSAVYRVTYAGSESTAPAGPLVNEAASKARELRRKLESFHGRQDPEAIAAAWPHLASTDRSIRWAARVALEHQNLKDWQEKAFAETRPAAVIQAMVAVARSREKSLLEKVVAKLNALPFKQLTEEQLLDALRAYQLAFIRLGKPTGEFVQSAAAVLSPLYPDQSNLANRELCQLLVYLEAPNTIERTLDLLKSASNQQDQMHYVFVLRNLANGWKPEQRKAFFGWINLADSSYSGGASFKKFLQQIRVDMLAKMSADEKSSLKEVIEGRQKIEVVKLETNRQFVHNWQLDDLTSLLSQVESGRSFKKGKAAYQATQCAKCHRFKGEGGDTGPDITGVGNRFKPEYILEALIEPSKVISDQYQNKVIVTHGGQIYTGRFIGENDKGVLLRTDPFAREPVTIPKDQIESTTPSPLSEMPQGLINTLTKEEILDLIAYLRSAGDESDKAFQK